MTVYRKASEIDWSQAQAFVGLGMVLVNLERYGEAINSFQQAIQVAPQSAAAHYHLGVALNK
jgi:Flp pilus assembly protein TadD